MKKIFVYFITFVLMMNFLMSNIVLATQEGEESQEMSVTTEETINNIVMPEIVKARAVVTEIGEAQQIQTDYMTETTQKIKVEILDGEYETKEFETEYILAYDRNQNITDYELKIGDEVSVQIIDNKDGNVVVQMQDVIRSNYVFMMVVLFIIVLVMISGKKAIKSLLTLMVITIATYLVLLKGIASGVNVNLVVLGFVSIVSTLNFLILSGFNKKTLSLILSTLVGIIFTMILNVILIYFSKISGVSENIIQLSMNMKDVKFLFKDILLVSIDIMALGFYMNLAMQIVNVLEEQKDKTADMSRREVFKSGMKIGKNQIANWLNTIVLFGVGISITLMLAFSACNISVTDMLNKESIVEIIIAVISVSISILVVMLIVPAIYALLNYKKVLYRTTSENKLDGNRSLKI